MVRGEQGERVTRRTDTLLSGLATFLTGLLVGVLGTFAAFAGRVSSIETTVAIHTQELSSQAESLRTELAMLSDIRTQLSVLTNAIGAPDEAAPRHGKER